MSIFIPKFADRVYFVNWEGNIVNYVICNSEQSTHLIKSGKCFRTEEDAVRARNRSYANRELEVLADELNGRVDIDWEDLDQEKFFIEYNYAIKCFEYYSTGGHWRGETTYCLDYNFLEVALEKLGENKLRLILEVE